MKYDGVVLFLRKAENFSYSNREDREGYMLF